MITECHHCKKKRVVFSAVWEDRAYWLCLDCHEFLDEHDFLPPVEVNFNDRD